MNFAGTQIESAPSGHLPEAAERNEQRWLNYDEVASRVGVCARTIRREVDEEKFPKPIKIRGCVRFDWKEVEAAMKARKAE